MYTTVNVANFCHRDDAERLKDTLKAALVNSYIDPEIGAAPAGGSFNVYVTTQYVFEEAVDEHGDCGSHDNQRALLSFLLHVLAHELVR